MTSAGSSHCCDNCDGIDPGSCLFNQPTKPPVDDDLRQRYAQTLNGVLFGYIRRDSLRAAVVHDLAADLAAVRDTELERLRFEGQNADTLGKDNNQLREEVTRLRINAEKDVCSGCMQREEQRDRWMESTRQNGVAYEQAKQAWYREQDRAKKAEADIARVRGLHHIHWCEVDGHKLDRTPNPCVNNGICRCGQRNPCPTLDALDSPEET